MVRKGPRPVPPPATPPSVVRSNPAGVAGAAEANTALVRDERALRRHIASIEANAHPDYGNGFRECVAALRGRTLHQVLSHVHATARLPPLDGGAGEGGARG